MNYDRTGVRLPSRPLGFNMSLIKQVNDSLEYANAGFTKLNEKAITMDGMSSFKVRNFLNKIVSYPDTSYLEIGVWRGSTFYSAMHGNKPKYALAIDNFSQFDGNELAFQINMHDTESGFYFINSDCFNLPYKPTEKFNVYFYDGDHSLQSHKSALTYYHDMLTDEYIYICDDWNWPEVKAGTEEGIKEKNLEIVQEWTLPADFNGDKINWWNGLWVAVIKKSAKI